MASEPIRPKQPPIPSSAPARNENEGPRVDPEPRVDSVEVARASEVELAMARTSDVSVSGGQIASAPNVPAELAPTVDLLTRAGLPPNEAFAIACVGIDDDEAPALLSLLLSTPTSLSEIGPKAIAIALASRAIDGGLLSREVRAGVAQFQNLVIVRPDGVIARATTGDPIEKAGDVHRDGDIWKAGQLEVAAFYASVEGVLYPITSDLAVDRSHGPAFELSADRMMYGRALDGAEKAGRGMILSLGRAIEDPPSALAEIFDALNHLGPALLATPELVERFSALPIGDQVEAASELAITALLGKAGSKAGAGLITSGGAPTGFTIEVTASIGKLAMTFDLSAAATGTAGIALLPLSAMGHAELLSRATEPKSGATSSLAPLSEKAKASVKRVAKELGKDVAASKAKEIQRATAAASKLIERIDGVLKRSDLSQLLRSRLETCKAALAEHLKPEDLMGALRDEVKLPVRQPGTGRVWNHSREVEEAIGALSNARDALGKEFRSRLERKGADRELSKLADEVRELSRALENVVETDQ